MKTGDTQTPGPVICCLGDIALTGRAFFETQRLGRSAAREKLWRPAEPADLIFFNLESSVCSGGTPRMAKRFNLNTDPAALDLLDHRAVAGLANNHVMDYGETGLAETLARLDERNIPHAGAGLNLEAARRPAVRTVRNSRLAFLCAADPRFDPATDHSSGTFPAIPDLLAESIHDARQAADAVIVSIHAGLEFSNVPFPRTMHLAERCLEAGARLVVFHHAHCPGAYRREDRGLILYGTGKYIFPYADFSSEGRFEYRLLRSARRSATWNVNVRTLDCRIHPVVIASSGLPKEPVPREAERIRREIEGVSRTLQHPLRLAIRRLLTLVHPRFVWLNAGAYLDIARRQGWAHTTRTFLAGLKVQRDGLIGPAVSRGLRRIVFWGLPVLLLYLIFSRIDGPAFLAHAKQADPVFALLGLLYYPLVILIGGLRWRRLLQQFNRCRVGVGFALKHYWIGLAVGFFGPASAGWDAYRLVTAGRRFGRFAPNAAAIVAEKLLALITCAGLVVGLYPFLPIESTATARMVLRTAIGLFSAAFAGLSVLALTRHRLARWIAHRTSRLLRQTKPAAEESAADALLEPLTSWRLLRGTLFLSIANLLIAALGNQIFFRAAGHPLPFAANLFVVPVLLFVFLLPISFGSLGIREGAYIMLYGLFGVPPETALLVSFFNLAGVLLNNLIGGLLMTWHGLGRRASDLAEKH